MVSCFSLRINPMNDINQEITMQNELILQNIKIEASSNTTKVTRLCECKEEFSPAIEKIGLLSISHYDSPKCKFSSSISHENSPFHRQVSCCDLEFDFTSHSPEILISEEKSLELNCEICRTSTNNIKSRTEAAISHQSVLSNLIAQYDLNMQSLDNILKDHSSEMLQIEADINLIQSIFSLSSARRSGGRSKEATLLNCIKSEELIYAKELIEYIKINEEEAAKRDSTCKCRFGCFSRSNASKSHPHRNEDDDFNLTYNLIEKAEEIVNNLDRFENLVSIFMGSQKLELNVNYPGTKEIQFGKSKLGTKRKTVTLKANSHSQNHKFKKGKGSKVKQNYSQLLTDSAEAQLAHEIKMSIAHNNNCSTKKFISVAWFRARVKEFICSLSDFSRNDHMRITVPLNWIKRFLRKHRIVGINLS